MRLEGKKIAVLLAEGFEDLEYWVTVMRLQEEGAEVITIGPNKDEVSGKNALTARADATADEVDAATLDGVVVPGGWAPDKLRRYEEITGLVKTVHERNKIVGIICHGGLVATLADSAFAAACSVSSRGSTSSTSCRPAPHTTPTSNRRPKGTSTTSPPQRCCACGSSSSSR